jgi:hypothetical protein
MRAGQLKPSGDRANHPRPLLAVRRARYENDAYL